MPSDHALFGTDPLSAAVAWLQNTLLGTIATSVAVIAVASVGFLMLTGRVDIRRAAQVIFGCFILFGASSIAQGIMGMASGITTASGEQNPPPDYQAAAAPPSYTPPAQSNYDPYAGAAVMPRQ
jgi:type IV secretory pathway VirB2 component (pilin)